MKITVKRDTWTNKSTTSIVYIDGVQFCYGMEDKDRYLENNPKDKVYGETAIPRGTYKVIINFSSRFQKLMPQVLDVPGFDGIRIHPGNSSADTHGCLLVGLSRTADYVSNSRQAFSKLMDILEEALDRGKTIEIEYI